MEKGGRAEAGENRMPLRAILRGRRRLRDSRVIESEGKDVKCVVERPGRVLARLLFLCFLIEADKPPTKITCYVFFWVVR